jgi:hypothetical protein
MYVPFDEMDADARLWIYQGDRPFTDTEKAAIENNLVHLCQTWEAHGAALRTSFKLDYGQFIILAVDERTAGASGCSIDGSVRLLKDLQGRLGIDFFNRRQVAFLEGTVIRMYALAELKSLFESGILSPDSVTFNNALTTKADWEKHWQVAARDSWLSRYLPKPAGVR